MKCPNCNSTVADDAAVCPKCDRVLDPSLLDASPPEDDGDVETTSPRPQMRAGAPARPATKPGVKKVAKKPGAPGKPAAKKPGAPSGARRMPDAPPPVKRETKPKEDWRKSVSEEDWNQMPQGPKKEFVPDKAMDPDDVLGDAKSFIFELSIADKLAFFGTVAMFIACFFPWKETVSEGEVLGLTSGGIVVFGLSGVAAAMMVIRVRKIFPKMNPLFPWIAQLGAVGFGMLWCLVYVKASWDSTLARSPIGNYEVWVSKPAFGVIFAFLSGAVAGLGTLFGLKDSSR